MVFQPNCRHKFWLPWYLHCSYCSPEGRERTLVLTENSLLSGPTSDTLQALIRVHPSIFSPTHRRVSERFWMLFDLRQLWSEELQFRPKTVWDLSMFTLGIWPLTSQWHIFTLIPKTKDESSCVPFNYLSPSTILTFAMDPAHLIGPVICKLICLCPGAHPSPLT